MVLLYVASTDSHLTRPLCSQAHCKALRYFGRRVRVLVVWNIESQTLYSSHVGRMFDAALQDERGTQTRTRPKGLRQRRIKGENTLFDLFFNGVRKSLVSRAMLLRALRC